MTVTRNGMFPDAVAPPVAPAVRDFAPAEQRAGAMTVALDLGKQDDLSSVFNMEFVRQRYPGGDLGMLYRIVIFGTTGTEMQMEYQTTTCVILTIDDL